MFHDVYIKVDEDIPDFVMEYLQSDQGHLDQDIPDHILDFIHTRAAALERNRSRQVFHFLFYSNIPNICQTENINRSKCGSFLLQQFSCEAVFYLRYEFELISWTSRLTMSIN